MSASSSGRARSLAFTLSLAVAATGSAGSAAAATWTCTAPGLLGFQYSGGGSAYIHLAPFQTGGTYAVTLAKDGKSAVGKTANGTRFTCTAR